jgi:hypothetical protein
MTQASDYWAENAIFRNTLKRFWPKHEPSELVTALRKAMGRGVNTGRWDIPLETIRAWGRNAGIEANEEWEKRAIAAIWKVPLLSVRLAEDFVMKCVTLSMLRLFEGGTLAHPAAKTAGFDTPFALNMQWFCEAQEVPPAGVSSQLISYLYRERLNDLMAAYLLNTQAQGEMGILVRRGMKELSNIQTQEYKIAV